MTTQIVAGSLADTKHLYDSALIQLAAEAYLTNTPLSDAYGFSPSSRLSSTPILEEYLKDRLLFGNNNVDLASIDFKAMVIAGDIGASPLYGGLRMTASQADYFLNIYEVVAQQPNTKSGFSGTLIRNKQTGEYTVAFRSTEYRLAEKGGDYYRDARATDTQLNSYGAAFTQGIDMEKFYAEVVEPIIRKNTPEGQPIKLNVEGYSLGGSLAYLFTSMHADVISETVVFNSPGLGPQGNTQPGEANYYATVIAKFKAIYDALPCEGNSWYLQTEVPSDLGPDNKYIMVDGERLEKLLSQGNGSTSAANWASAWARTSKTGHFGTDWESNIFSEARHELAWAIIKGLYHPSKGSVLYTGPGADLIQNYFGRASRQDLEMTAGLNTSVKPEQPILIEDQPMIEKWLGHMPIPVIGGITEGWVGDFGNTHSLALIIDSLAVTQLLQTLSPGLTRDQAQAIMISGNNESASGLLATAGRADSSTMEKVLQALTRKFLPELADTKLNAGTAGSDFTNIVNRKAFYERIAAIQDAAASGIASGSFEVIPLSTVLYGLIADSTAPLGTTRNEAQMGQIMSGIVAMASETTARGLAARRALVNLDSFMIVDAQETTADGLAFDKDSTGVGVTAAYLSARLEMLTRILNTNVADQPESRADNRYTGYDPSKNPLMYANDNFYFEDKGTGRVFSHSNPAANTSRYIFGGNNDETINGGTGADKLFGGGGVDRLYGGKGNDYLEGGVGNDFLYGGCRCRYP